MPQGSTGNAILKGRPEKKHGNLDSVNLYNYKVMNNLSAETITDTDTGNYTAWTLLTSCIMADGSLLNAVGLMAMVTETSALEPCHNALTLKDRLKSWGFPTFLSISPFFPQAIKSNCV